MLLQALQRIMLDKGTKGSSPAPSSGEETFGQGPGKVHQSRSFLGCNGTGTHQRRSGGHEEHCRCSSARQERAVAKKAIFHSTLNYLKRLHRPPNASQSLEGTMQILLSCLPGETEMCLLSQTRYSAPRYSWGCLIL